ncbi:hypothetical protein TTHERM_00423300 (macronuclear) [Tetrahymena thermophila SB210]|uniref:Uncharacterized protein n=1 Tax=Tetrahymena thermophila (strain SB210) TaxID=312017 RepID=Q23AN1_TETTS|nr:hypothetical protein TTHERM_00423300 [Tetrahymena thermophila SB210]EAR93461.2 hypothetical protein TTHERM_00423300 [Tetrahymena thermophila SB210]|eukprot:XP_001013706.2 hypothetical protein TTHERM_00423300 [Tetrahymena thermophila SB210]
MSTELQNTDNIQVFQGHRNSLIYIQISNSTIYSVNVQGDIILFDALSSNILNVYNCTHTGGKIDQQVLFSSTFDLFMYYDTQQSTINVYSLQNKKVISSLQTPNLQLIQIIEVEINNKYVFLFDNGKYAATNLIQGKIEIFSISDHIQNISQSQLAQNGTSIFLFSQSQSLSYIESFTFYSISWFEILNDSIYYSLKESTKGIIIYSLSQNQIINDLSCQILPYNLNLVTSPLNIYHQQDLVVLSHYAGVAMLDLTNLSIQKQMRILSQRNSINLQTLVYKQYDLIVITDKQYTTLLSYYTLEVILFLPVPNIDYQQVVFFENLSNNALYIGGSQQQNIVLYEIDLKIKQVKLFFNNNNQQCLDMILDFDLQSLRVYLSQDKQV